MTSSKCPYHPKQQQSLNGDISLDLKSVAEWSQHDKDKIVLYQNKASHVRVMSSTDAGNLNKPATCTK